MSEKIKILDKATAQAKLKRMAYEIVEQNYDESSIIIAGITDRGYQLAELLAKDIAEISKMKVKLIAIQIDKTNPTDCILSDEKQLDGKCIVVVDDVANSGRTLLYALNPFLNILAKKIQIAVMVDRKHKSYPVSPDYVGITVNTTLQEHISLEFQKGAVSGAYLL